MSNKQVLRSSNMRHLPRLMGLVWLMGAAACAEGSVLTLLSAGLYSGGTGGTAQNIDSNINVGGSDVVLIGQGFNANAGQQLFATIFDVQAGHLLTQTAGFSLVDSGGNFQMSWKNLVVPGQELNIAFYADVNNDAVCNAIPVDGGWEVNLKTLNQGTVVAVTPTIAQRSVCGLFGSYAFSFDSAGNFAGHGYPGHNAYAAVVDMLDNSLVGEVQAAAISSTGQVTFNWPGILVSHHRYAIPLCVDTANNGSCDQTALYAFTTNPVSADVKIDFTSTMLPVASRTFSQYWPQNVTLPPPPVGPIPTLGKP